MVSRDGVLLGCWLQLTLWKGCEVVLFSQTPQKRHCRRKGKAGTEKKDMDPESEQARSDIWSKTSKAGATGSICQNLWGWLPVSVNNSPLVFLVGYLLVFSWYLDLDISKSVEFCDCFAQSLQQQLFIFVIDPVSVYCYYSYYCWLLLAILAGPQR